MRTLLSKHTLVRYWDTFITLLICLDSVQVEALLFIWGPLTGGGGGGGGVLILHVDFKEAPCRPVEFNKCSCRPVKFKKCLSHVIIILILMSHVTKA